MENIIIVTFETESEAYQAFSELKSNTSNRSYIISQAALARNTGGKVEPLDWFSAASDDTVLGGALGALIGIVGGPVGVLLGGASGALLGGAVDMADAGQSIALMEHVMGCVTDGRTVLIAMVQEEEPAAFDANFAKYQSEVTRFDAAEIAVEVEEAQIMEEEMALQERKQALQEKREALREKAAEHRARIKAEFEDLKSDMKELREL